MFARTQLRERGFASALVGVTLLLAALASGCATQESGSTTSVIREPAETQTGSNLPRRGEKRNTGVSEADKDAISSAVRGASRNTGQ